MCIHTLALRRVIRAWQTLLAVNLLLCCAGCGTQIHDVTHDPHYKTGFVPGGLYVLRQSALLEAWVHPTRYALISNAAANLRRPPPECGPWSQPQYYPYRGEDHATTHRPFASPHFTLARLKAAELRAGSDNDIPRRWYQRSVWRALHHNQHQNPWIRTICPAGAQVRIVALDRATGNSRSQLLPVGQICTGPLAGLRVWLAGLGYVNPFTHILEPDTQLLVPIKPSVDAPAQTRP